MSVSDKPSTLRAQMKHHEPIICFQQNQRDEVRLVVGGGIIGAISANPGMKNQNYLCISVKTKQIDMRTSENEAHPLDGNDNKEPQAVCYSVDALSSNSMKSKNPHSGFHKTAVSKCLDTMCCDPSCNQGGVMVCYERTNGED